ncbi:efflux RND transporter periplasmic adaptor subunit [Azohydromonas caseinilytica]|uniref:Efflux RND transporter periplasmic adaptor subunit n=1 Tax=Azohydromonas caseinilytica TaxID=2728836 RepID=A0A848FI93_9BURK|nr:efflux RND transporter periplasmic adaptor subunit [Azohydromonas caseinilytica]NML17920.1 efflux RND transporter periplasmic adaptor subunit [Azohydromonas caseinilytica]
MKLEARTAGGWGMAAALALAGLLGGCNQQAVSQPAAPQPPVVSLAPAFQREVQEFEEFTARLEAPDTVEVRARVAGALEQVHFTEGQRVAKGALLFTIDPRPFAAEVARAEAQLAAARNQADLGASELARAEKLTAIQGVSQQELDQLRATVRNTRANIQSAEAALVQARLNLEFTRIRAPVAGRISRALVTPGNLVSVGTPVLTTLVSQDRVHAYFDASEATYLKYLRLVRAGTLASPRTEPTQAWMGLADETGFPHQGRIDFVDNRLNPATGSIRGRAVFDNRDGRFTPGLFARVKVVGSGKYPATLVPDRAIGTDQTRKVVLLVGQGNVVQLREVQPGALIDGMRVVQGVQPGELVIVDGLQRAQPGAPVTPQVLQVDDKGMPIPAAASAPAR